MRKRFMSMMLSVLMICSVLNTYASATTHSVAVGNASESNVVTPTILKDNTESELTPIKDRDVQLNLNGEVLADFSNYAYRRSAVSVTQQVVDTLSAEGDAKYILFSLSQNQVAQITLRSPDNADLNYDLMLYTVSDEGYVEDLVDSSTLATYINSSGHTLDDSISCVHTSSDPQQYAVFVYATTGGSSEETFTLTISLDLVSNLDSYEPNDSPYSPTTLTMNSAGSVSGLSLNVINDQDWLLWSNDDGFDKLAVSATQGHQVEVYHVENGNQMVLNPYTTVNGERVYSVVGLNYIRVFSETDNANFSYAAYELSLHPYRSAALASTILVSMNGDQGADSYVTYYDTTLFRYTDVLSPTVTVLDSEGRPIEGVSVKMTLASSFWSEASGNQIQTYYSTLTDANGCAIFDVHPPATLGTFSVYLPGAISFIHHVDIDALVFTVGDASASTQVYRLAYSEYVGS